MSASVTKLQDLHNFLADTLRQQIEAAKGEDGTGEIPASLLNTVRQFLKDNDIQAVPVPDSSLKKLAERLPFGEDEEEEPPAVN